MSWKKNITHYNPKYVSNCETFFVTECCQMCKVDPVNSWYWEVQHEHLNCSYVQMYINAFIGLPLVHVVAVYLKGPLIHLNSGILLHLVFSAPRKVDRKTCTCMSLQWEDVIELQYLTWETEMNNLCQIATSKQKNTLK